MLRTGILLPRSTLFPSLGIDILNGFKENLKRLELHEQILILTDNIGFGVNEAEIYTKAEKFLLQDNMDLVIVCADTKITELLQPLFTATNKILLMLNFGANFPESWQPAPTTITHSLNFCLHAALTGELAAAEENKETINVISYYDGGYRQCFSMLYANQLHGGVPLLNHVTHIKLEEFTLEPVAVFLQQNPDAKTLLCLFAGEQAEKFYQVIVPVQKNYDLHFFVSPMMLDEQLDNSSTAITRENVKGFVPWHSTLPNNNNAVFKETYRAAYDKPVNYFSLLGWEAGLLVTEILQQFNKGNKNAIAIVQQLLERNLESPRGWMRIDAATHHVYGPSYLCSAAANNEVLISAEKENAGQAWKNFTEQKIPAAESSGWRNTYLCI